MSTWEASSLDLSVAPRVSGVTPVAAWVCSASTSVLALILIDMLMWRYREVVQVVVVVLNDLISSVTFPRCLVIALGT